MYFEETLKSSGFQIFYYLVKIGHTKDTGIFIFAGNSSSPLFLSRLIPTYYMDIPGIFIEVLWVFSGDFSSMVFSNDFSSMKDGFFFITFGSWIYILFDSVINRNSEALLFKSNFGPSDTYLESISEIRGSKLDFITGIQSLVLLR